MHMILPKKRPVLSPPLSSLPMFFLAGPIQGAGDWHRQMSEMLHLAVGDCLIVNPSRYDESHPHYRHALDGPVLDERQTDWERYYLAQAGLHWHAGCVIFWLAAQVGERKDGKPYASDTRGELGEWRAHMMYNPQARVVIGAELREDGLFLPGLDVIVRNFEQALGKQFRLCETMDEVIDQASLLAQPKLSFTERISA